MGYVHNEEGRLNHSARQLQCKGTNPQPDQVSHRVLIGVFTTEMDEPNGTVWARCCDYGVTSATMKNAGEADRLRLWRPVTWVREGDWQDVANTTKTSMNGIQVQTISCFTNGTMHMVFDMLKKSRPVVAAQLPKQPVPVVPLPGPATGAARETTERLMEHAHVRGIRSC